MIERGRVLFVDVVFARTPTSRDDRRVCVCAVCREFVKSIGAYVCCVCVRYRARERESNLFFQLIRISERAAATS